MEKFSGKPKKYFGQHFLKDQVIAQKIIAELKQAQMNDQNPHVLEIGPGTGVLTSLLCEDENLHLDLIEIDHELVIYLKKKFPKLVKNIFESDILKYNLESLGGKKINIIGNFPYNISSQIFFKVLSHRHYVDQVICMLQKEVAERICSKQGNKVYGILSVLLQAYYHCDYLFSVPPHVFNPPPKVNSAVIRLKRNATLKLNCDEDLFEYIVKQSFQKRRKTLRNALKHLNLPVAMLEMEIMKLRAEQLTVVEYISLTQLLEIQRENTKSF